MKNPFRNNHHQHEYQEFCHDTVPFRKYIQQQILQHCQKSNRLVWLVINKSDLNLKNANISNPAIKKILKVSAKTGTGVEYLLDAIITDCIENYIASEDSSKLFINLRQKQCFDSALPHIKHAINENRVELICLEIRQALANLDQIIGKTDNEDILGRIFSKFCIGK